MSFRQRLSRFIDQPSFGQFITGVIVINAVRLGQHCVLKIMFTGRFQKSDFQKTKLGDLCFFS